MTRTLVLFEDEGFVNLLPLVLWRSVLELRVGRKIILDRTAQELGLSVGGVWTRDWLGTVTAQRCGAPANHPIDKTTILANPALAAARAGSRVLAIDADFSAQDLMQLLAAHETPHKVAFTDVVVKNIPLDQAISNVGVGGAGSLSLMGRGTVEIAAATFFQTEEVGAFFSDVKEQYDLVLIDAPPLLQVAYTGLLLRLADAALVVVAHNTNIQELEEVQDRLDITGTPSIGYVYNGAPLRRRLAGPEGSIGEEGFRR